MLLLTLCSVISAWSGRSEIPRMQPNTAKSDRSGFSPPQIKSRFSISKITHPNEFPLSKVVQVTTKGFAANFCSPCLEYRNTICCEFIISGHFHLSLEPQQLWKEHPARSPCHTFSWSCHVLRPYLHGSALLHRHQVQHHLLENTGKKRLKTQNTHLPSLTARYTHPLANLVHPQLEWPQHVAAKIPGIFANIPMPLSTQTEKKKEKLAFRTEFEYEMGRIKTKATIGGL